jgi:hypothetical protein
MGLGLIEYLTNEVYWSLDLVRMPDLLTLDDDGHADHPVGCCDVEQQISPSLGTVKTGEDVRNYLSSAKVVSASSDHSKFSYALRSLKNGKPFSSSRDMNRLRAAMHPISFWMSLTHLGSVIFMIALTFLG